MVKSKEGALRSLDGMAACRLFIASCFRNASLSFLSYRTRKQILLIVLPGFDQIIRYDEIMAEDQDCREVSLKSPDELSAF